MSNIEDLVRQSLRHRAEDVEVTPALWREVDRRITRRRRVQVAAWSLAGAATLAAAALIAPGVLATSDPTPEVEPLPPGPDQVDPEEDGEAAPTDDGEVEAPEQPSPDDTAPEPSPGGDDAAGEGIELPEPVLVAQRGRLELIGPDGRELVHEFLEEGGSIITGLAVRPGSTLDDYTAAVLTTSEGLWDLRHLHVVDGEVVTIEPFDDPYRPGPDDDTQTLSVGSPVFSPDGTSLLWLERPVDGDTVLRTIGWDEGPGTGRTADDNARFTLDGVEQDVELMDVIASPANDGEGAEGFELRMTRLDAGPSWLRYPLQRQADGAWAMAPDAVAIEVSVPGGGGIVAVGGAVGDADASGVSDPDDGTGPRWLVRLGEDPIIWDRAASDGPQLSLPAEMFAGEGVPSFWLRPVGDGVLVGTPNTSVTYLFDRGALVRLPGEVAWAGVIG